MYHKINIDTIARLNTETDGKIFELERESHRDSAAWAKFKELCAKHGVDPIDAAQAVRRLHDQKELERALAWCHRVWYGRYPNDARWDPFRGF